MTLTTRYGAPLGLALALLVGGCATAPGGGGTGTPGFAEFLTYPERLAPAPGGNGALVWIAPDAKLAGYDRFLIERIQVRLADDADYKTVDPTELKALSDYLHQAIVKALAPAFKVVSKPGPGVLRIRIGITDLVPTKPEYSVATLVVPYATVADLASGPMSGEGLGSAPYLGRTGIAGELIDARTGRVLAQYADTQVGRKYVVDTSQGVAGAVTAGVGDYLRSYSTWAYARQAFDGWAQELRQWLDGVHGH